MRIIRKCLNWLIYGHRWIQKIMGSSSWSGLYKQLNKIKVLNKEICMPLVGQSLKCWRHYHNSFLSCTGSIWAFKIVLTGYIFVKYKVTDQDIVFLVPDSCWAGVKNCNSISMDITEDTIIKKRLNWHWCLLSFRQYGSCFGLFDIAGQHNIHPSSDTITIHLHLLSNRAEKFARVSLSYMFLKLVQINYIFSDNVCILPTLAQFFCRPVNVVNIPVDFFENLKKKKIILSPYFFFQFTPAFFWSTKYIQEQNWLGCKLTMTKF